MKTQFDSPRDANMYFGNTYITYDGQPFHVLEVDENFVAKGLVGGKPLNVPLSDEKVSGKPPQLGYVNTEGGAVYLVRRPVRSVKQGLDIGRVRPMGGRPDGQVSRECLMACFLGQYPALKDTRDMFKSKNPFRAAEGRDSVAFSRHFAVNTRSVLLYKGRPVGKVKDGVPELDERHMWLSEALQEVLDVQGQVQD